MFEPLYELIYIDNEKKTKHLNRSKKQKKQIRQSHSSHKVLFDEYDRACYWHRGGIQICLLCGWAGSLKGPTNRKRHILGYHLSHIGDIPNEFIRNVLQTKFDKELKELHGDIDDILHGDVDEDELNKNKSFRSQHIAMGVYNAKRKNSGYNTKEVHLPTKVNASHLHNFRELITKFVVSSGSSTQIVNNKYFHHLLQVILYFTNISFFNICFSI